VEEALLVVIILGIVTLGPVMLLWSHRRAGDLLDVWARARGVELLSSERRWLRRGPYFWSSNGQEVFHVTVREPSGRVRRAYVRCGNFFVGMLADDVEERWED
jgi:hypothetical protein